MRKPEGTGELPPVEDYATLHADWRDVPLTRRDLIRFALGILMLGAVLGGLLVWFLTRRALAADGPSPPYSGSEGTFWMQLLILVGVVAQLMAVALGKRQERVMFEIRERYRIEEVERQRKWEVEDRHYKETLAGMMKENTDLTSSAVDVATAGNDCVEKLAKVLALRKTDVASLEKQLVEAKDMRRRGEDPNDVHGR